MLAEKNNDIRKVYDRLQKISKDEKSRMAYEAREAEIHDQMTRIKTAREETATKIAVNLLKMGLTVEQIANAAELTLDKVVEIKKNMRH